jgi:hypothetical protein
MSYSSAEARQFKYMVIRSNGATHTGFPIRNRDKVPNGYQLMGRANTTAELKAIMFPH